MKRKNRERSLYFKLFRSLILLVLNVCLLAASTYAWFTATAYTEDNRINTGFLGIDLLITPEYLGTLDYTEDENNPLKTYTRKVYDSENDETTVETYKIVTNTNVPVIKLINVEPGQVYPISFKVLNRGDLAATYTASFDVVDSNTGIETLTKQANDGGFVLKYAEDGNYVIDNRDKLPSDLYEYASQLDTEDFQIKMDTLSKEQRNKQGEDIGGHLEDVLEVYLGKTRNDVNIANRIGTISEIMSGEAKVYDGYILPKSVVYDATNERINPTEVILYDDEGVNTSSQTNVSEIGNLDLLIFVPEDVDNLYKYASITMKVGVQATQTEYEYDGLHCMMYDQKAGPKHNLIETGYFGIKNIDDKVGYVGFLSQLNNSLAIGQQGVNDIEYSTDLLTWTKLETCDYRILKDDVSSLIPYFIEVQPNSTIYYRTTVDRRLSSTNENYNFFQLLNNNKQPGGKFKLVGNINYLINKNGEASYYDDYCFFRLFTGNSGLIYADELSMTASSVRNSSCYYMFSGCTNLEKPPVLPATSLGTACYKNMFSGDISLLYCPELPSPSTAEQCYFGMFNGCTKITEAPELTAAVMSPECYAGMFQECHALLSCPDLNSTSLATKCYQSMFVNCVAITEAPALPATTLFEGCYTAMFSKCSCLISAQTELPATNIPKEAYLEMFFGCTSITKAPHIKAVSYDESSFNRMFADCSLLSEITIDITSWPTIETDISTNDAFHGWINSVSASGTFKCYSGLTDTRNGVHRIPIGWTIERISNGS